MLTPQCVTPAVSLCNRHSIYVIRRRKTGYDELKVTLHTRKENEVTVKNRIFGSEKGPSKSAGERIKKRKH